jgi:hypothetical protein
VAEGIEAKIMAALMGRLQALPQSPTVAWPGLDFQPAIGTPYLRPSFLSVPTVQATLGLAGFNRYSGILQVSVFHPINQGIIAPTEIAAAVAAHFKRGTSMAQGGVTVRVEAPPTVNTALTEDGWHHTPVSISWFADVPNPS